MRDYSYLHIPYCTGDVHIGNGELGTVRFNGMNNTLAALEWVYSRVPQPESVLTVGCSAGSLGATVWSRWVSDHYRSSRCVSLGDSYVGVMNEDWWRTLDENWRLFDSFYPAPGLELERLRDFRPDIVGYIGRQCERALSHYWRHCVHSFLTKERCLAQTRCPMTRRATTTGSSPTTPTWCRWPSRRSPGATR